MTAPGEVIQLTERFERNRDAYLSGQYNETQLRREFLDPMFISLGWDVNNTQGYAEAYKDVIHEDAIKVGGVAKAPDYCFRIGGTRKFFVEAKKPAVRLKEEISPAFQLRRYAWSAKLPLSILTDFEEFAVYDCRIKPAQTDKASTARILYITYREYQERWEEISSVFTREAVLKGSFDKYAETGKHKKGTAQVDDSFLEEIEIWRELLARNIALRNPNLTQRELNFAVQRTIDRVIFLRICEDRGIENYGRLQSLLNGTSVYRRLFEIFRNADERYNSGLFHFETEKGRHESPDDLTPSLDIDDKVLKDILKRLYYPESPYEFSVLPADILGQVYEQFLGKVIRLTPGHQAKVEEKPEVRKAGGVYYTPTYIVDYIVKNTVGPLVEGKSPKDASKLRVLDPACGSGSFLLGAYQYLLDWHRDWYEKDDPKKWSTGKNPAVYQAQGGYWRLTTGEKKRILLNNIYGVDIDSQAVEVTKLSLLLKVLEDENDQTIARQLRFFHERALPDLGDNIKCGNSLIGPDFYEMGAGQELSLFDDEERYRINVFDWKAEFPVIMKAGGFDAVIGNPPYIRMEGFKPIKDYLKSKYRSHEERADIYSYFLERGINLLTSSGRIGMIVSNKFMKAKYGRPLRKVFNESAVVDSLTDFAGADVFQNATVRTIVIIAQRTATKKLNDVVYVPVPDHAMIVALRSGRVQLNDYTVQKALRLDAEAISEDGWQLLSKGNSQLLNKIRLNSLPLHEWIGSSALFGLKTGLNEAFILDGEKRKELLKKHPLSKEIIKPILFGKDVRRYFIEGGRQHVIYCHPDKNIDNYPSVRDHVATFKQALIKRATKQKWYELQQPATALIDINLRPKIVYPIIAKECRFTLDTEGYYINDKVFLLPNADLSLLGILNSRVANFYFGSVCAALESSSERYLEFRAQYVDMYPIPQVLSQWNKKPVLEKLVFRMLALNKQLPLAKTDHEKTALQRQIDATDKQIDKLVYELYELTEDEIRIVESDER